MSVEYRVEDAVDALDDEPADSAAFVHLDDAWARPKRNGAFGVEYPTHPFSEDDEHADDPDVTVVDVLEACLRVTAPEGVLVVDTDDWLVANLLPWLQARLDTGQYRTGDVVATTKDGSVDCSTPGMYLSTGGYSVVFASSQGDLGEIDTRTTAPRQRENYGWGSAKPVGPYREWLRQTTEPGDRVLVPCAGTAPTAIAAEIEHGDRANVLAIDVEPEAKEAYQRRRASELDRQTGLEAWGEA